MEEKEKQSILERIKLYIIKPKEFFENYKENPKYLFHLIIIAVIACGTYLISNNINKSTVNESLDSASQGLSGQELDIFNSITGLATNPVFGVITTIIGLLISVYVGAAIYYLIIKVIFKGEGTYSHMVLLTLITTYPTRIANLISSFIPATVDTSFGHAFLSYVNIPSLWSLLLIIIGTSVLFKMSMKKSAIIHCVLFVIGLLWTLGLNGLDSMTADLNNIE